MNDSLHHTNPENNLPKFKLRMILFLAIVAVDILAITHVNSYIVSKEQDLLRGINLSGRQRMLSQRIPLLTSVIVREGSLYGADEQLRGSEPPDFKTAVSQLGKAIKLMQTSHTALLYGSEDMGLPPAPQAYVDYIMTSKTVNFTEGGETLDERIKDFIGDATIVYDIAQKIGKEPVSETEHQLLLNGYNHIYSHAYNELLNDIDEGVYVYENAGRSSLMKVKALEPILFGGSLVMLLIVWFYVFRPMENKIRSNLLELEEKKNRFDMALKGASTGIWDWNIATGDFYWSPVLLELLGLQNEDGLTANVSYYQSILHADDKDYFNAEIARHLKNNTPFEVDCRLRHNDGQWVWIRCRGQALRNADNWAYRMLGSIEDITMIKHAEEQTRIFIKGIETAEVPFAMIDLDTPGRKFIYASPSFCGMTGYPQAKLQQSNLNVFTGPETSMNALDQIDYTLSERKSLTIKMIHYKADGTSFWNKVSIHPITLEEDTQNFYSVIFNDLTETLIKEKQEVARQRNESLGSLASSVAHEINNLLMPMTMAKDMLEGELKDDCDPFAREQLDVITDYANQAKTIVQGILTFSRKETKNMQKVNLYEELESAVNFIQSLMSNKTTLLLKQPDDEELLKTQAMINTTEMKQIITNLCRNAEDAFGGRDGKITISFSVRKLSMTEKNRLDVIANEFSVITVKDDGSGIPPDILDKIFEPLFTTKDIGKGTGLGLSVVVGILRSWGGAISVKSVLGVGTVFDLYIPVFQSEDDFSYLEDLADEFDEDSFKTISK